VILPLSIEIIRREDKEVWKYQHDMQQHIRMTGDGVEKSREERIVSEVNECKFLREKTCGLRFCEPSLSSDVG